MVTKYAILGFLSREPQTGYDLKRKLSDSPYLYRLDNSNQIYKILIQLTKEGLVVSEAKNQVRHSAGKIYRITETGLKELKKWIASIPGPVQMDNTFLVQLTLADLLENIELELLLEKYTEEVHLQSLMLQEKFRRESSGSENTRNGKYLWTLVMKRIMSHYENELQWVENLRRTLVPYVKEGIRHE